MTSDVSVKIFVILVLILAIGILGTIFLSKTKEAGRNEIRVELQEKIRQAQGARNEAEENAHNFTPEQSRERLREWSDR